MESRIGKWVIKGFSIKDREKIYQRLRSKAKAIIVKKHHKEYLKVLKKLRKDFLKDIKNSKEDSK